MLFSFFIFILILMTFASAYCSASEMALFSLNPARLKFYRNHLSPRKRLIAHLISHPHDLLVTILILNVAINILIQNIASHLSGNDSGWLLTVGAPLCLTLIFGELIPKSVGLQNNDKIAHAVAPVISKVSKVLGPVQRLVSVATVFVSKMFFFYLHKEKPLPMKALDYVLKTSEEQGLLSSMETHLIRGYLELQEVTVKELMHPRDEILYYDNTTPLVELEILFEEQQCSRIPICQGELEDVVGILHVNDYFIHRPNIHNIRDLLPILSKPYYVPESTSARLLFEQMTRRNDVLALVVDEYGSVEGLLTLEDLMEVVVGDISDLRDTHMPYTIAGKDAIIASGKLELWDFEEFYEVELVNPHNMVTIGGWLTSCLGDIPKNGSKHTYQGFSFHVLASDEKRVKRLYIRKITGDLKDGE